MRIGQLEQDGAELLVEFADVGLRMRQEIGQFHLVSRYLLQLIDNDLERPLKELDLALDQQEVAFFKRAKLMLAGVPLPANNAARPIAELDLEVEVAVAIGPELLVADQKNFLQRFAIRQLLHEPSSHVESFSKDNGC